MRLLAEQVNTRERFILNSAYAPVLAASTKFASADSRFGARCESSVPAVCSLARNIQKNIFERKRLLCALLKKYIDCVELLA